MLRSADVLARYSGDNCPPEAGELTRQYFAEVGRQGVEMPLPPHGMSVSQAVEWLKTLSDGELARWASAA